MGVQSKSKSMLMASCVLEEFDYQQGVNLSFSLPDGTLILSSSGNDIHDRKDYKQNACFVKNYSF